MCGPKFCSMHHSRTIDEGLAKMAAEAGLAPSSHASVVALDKGAALAGAAT